MTLAEVEGAIGLSDGNLSRIERGEQWLSEDLLWKLAKALGVSPAQFFEPAASAPEPPPRESKATEEVRHLLTAASKDAKLLTVYRLADADDRLLIDALIDDVIERLNVTTLLYKGK